MRLGVCVRAYMRVCVRMCVRMCAQSVLIRCGGDEAAPFMWPKLLHLDLNYNAITELDDSLVCICMESMC